MTLSVLQLLPNKLYKYPGVIIYLLLLITELHAQSQDIIKGRIIDKETNKPIPFVHVRVKNNNTGTVSDIDGNFRLVVPDEPEIELECTHVSYDKYLLKYHGSKNFLSIYLTPKSTELNEVLIVAGKNPAHEIIRRVVANRDKLNPNNLHAFSYQSYNKVYGTLEGYQKDTLNQKDNSTALDSMLSNNHFMMIESYTERHFKQPDISNETVIANHVSGYKNPIFSVVPTDLQPIAFYEDYVTLLENNFLNPISPGSTDKYQFILEDTIRNKTGDDVYVITFQPEAGKNFNALKGILYINGKDYALENVEAETANESLLISAKIRQKYEKINGKYWFPVQYNTQYTFSRQLIRGKPMVAIGKSYLSHIEINDQAKDYSFDHLALKIAPDAHIKDSLYWADVRPAPLEPREEKTYEFYNDHPRIKTIRTLYKIVEIVVLGYIETGPFNISVDDLFEWNRYEGTRLGLSLATNNSIADWFSLTGSVAYGLKDKAIKYGGSLQFNVNEKRDLHLKFSYRQDVEEPGKVELFEKTRNRFSSETFRDWLTSRMDSLKEYRMEVDVRPLPHLQTTLFLSRENINPTYNYQLDQQNDQLFSKFNTTEVGLDLKYIAKEKLAKVKDRQLMIAPTYPEFALGVAKGMDWLNGDFEYYKVDFKVDHKFLTRGLGETYVRLNGGWSTGTIPYHNLYHGAGSNVNEIPVVIKYYFQSMGPYEFLSDKYLQLFFTHDFGRLLFNPKSKVFKPEFSITQNFGWGELDNKDRHQQLDFKTMEQGYLESGITVNNLIRINYLNFAYFGFGAGVFYRYGPYAHQKQIDNLALKFIFDVSI